MRILILTILFSFCLIGCTEMNHSSDLIAKVDSLRIENDSLTKLLNEKTPEKNYWYDDEYDGAELIRKGIKNPSEFIVTSLRERTELIPFDAVLGGTMYFANIQLLGSEWVIADFSDGHIQGVAIYSYRLTKNNQLEFELLHSIGPE